MEIQRYTYPPLQPDPGKLLVIRELPQPPRIRENSQPRLIALNEHLQLWQIDLISGCTIALADFHLPDFRPEHPVQLVISPCGQAAAVCNRFGRHATVVSLKTGHTLLELSRGTYYFDKSTYPLAFAEREQELVLIHGVDWNRLELTVFLPEAGPVAASTIHAEASSASQADDLDYFHGQLHVSPNHTYIAETGWAWSPTGITRVWNLSNGAQNKPAMGRDEELSAIWTPLTDWDLPMVWLDNERLAVWGQIDGEMVDEEDWQEEGTRPAILVYNAAKKSREMVLTDLPAYVMSSGTSEVFIHAQAQLAASNSGRLFAWGTGLPLHCWNLPDMQTQIYEFPVQPDLYHRQANLFLRIGERGLEAWRCL
ncbi:hypothetical protein AB4Z30_25415 [Paenibacillus sp. 2TAF8]|uniref:hypothetical protein n=1 Tax=Paenibacillus sp. 2TAF8 TaxID=3233020 RepID=UPI003F9C573E